MRRTAWTDASGRPRGPKMHEKIMIRSHTLNLHIDCNKLFFLPAALAPSGPGASGLWSGSPSPRGSNPPQWRSRRWRKKKTMGGTSGIEIMSVFDFPQQQLKSCRCLISHIINLSQLSPSLCPTDDHNALWRCLGGKTREMMEEG